MLEFPGGVVDSSETGEQAAIRELYEETGIKNLPVLGEYASTNEYGGIIYFVILHNNTSQEPEITESYRKQKYYWLKPGDIPRDEFYSADIEFIEFELKITRNKRLLI